MTLKTWLVMSRIFLLGNDQPFLKGQKESLGTNGFPFVPSTAAIHGMSLERPQPGQAGTVPCPRDRPRGVKNYFRCLGKWARKTGAWQNLGLEFGQIGVASLVLTWGVGQIACAPGFGF